MLSMPGIKKSENQTYASDVFLKIAKHFYAVSSYKDGETHDLNLFTFAIFNKRL
jgi:hypothetical protein